MSRGCPTTLDSACAEARYYARNWSSKTDLDPEECEQEAMISAWKWWEGGRERTDLWHMVKLDLIDYARSVRRFSG